MSDNEEDSALADLKDLEFKLLHDLTQLQVATPVTEPCFSTFSFFIMNTNQRERNVFLIRFVLTFFVNANQQRINGKSA